MNICIVGHGMMGVWHSDALIDWDCRLHTIVGRRPEPTKAFADQYGYSKWTVDFSEALTDKEIDIIILATPSQMHAENALESLAAGKHTLVEIPIAMNFKDAKRVVDFGRESGLTLGVVHPLRFRWATKNLRNRILAGEENIRQIVTRFYIHRLENVGGTGYKRSWTDNLLWHHITHSLDMGLWLLNEPVREVHSFMPPPDLKTGIPMEVFLGIETEKDQSLVCNGSYYSRENMWDATIITDRDAYQLDFRKNKLSSSESDHLMELESDNCALVTRDFVQAVKDNRQPAVTGESVLPAMRVLQIAQDNWDKKHGTQVLPGRPL